MQPHIQVLLACYIDGSFKRLLHHQLQQWQVHISEQLQLYNAGLQSPQLPVRMAVQTANP